MCATTEIGNGDKISGTHIPHSNIQKVAVIENEQASMRSRLLKFICQGKKRARD